MFFDISDVVDCPILIWTVDSSIYCANKEAIRQNPSRYLFCTDEDSAKFFTENLGVKESQIHPTVHFSAFEPEDLPIQDNIVFIGTRFFNGATTCITRFLAKNPTDSERKEYQIALEYFRKHPFSTREELIHKKILRSETVIQNFETAEFVQELSDEHRIRVLSAVSDLGLKIYGTPNWALGTHFYESNLQLCYTSQKVFSREEQQKVYNLSKIGISAGHIQAVSGFPWRTLDLMRTNACLVSDFHSDFQKLFPMELFPIYHSPGEARSIVKELLENEKTRLEIVHNCQKFARENFSFDKVLEMIKNLSVISL